MFFLFSFLSFFNYLLILIYFKKIFLILIALFYFALFYFSFFLSFFLPFLLSRVADRVLVLQPGGRPLALSGES